MSETNHTQEVNKIVCKTKIKIDYDNNMGNYNTKELKTTTDLCIADADWLQKQYEISMCL